LQKQYDFKKRNNNNKVCFIIPFEFYFVYKATASTGMRAVGNNLSDLLLCHAPHTVTKTVLLTPKNGYKKGTQTTSPHHHPKAPMNPYCIPWKCVNI